MAILIADDFRSRFGDTDIPSTGTLSGDIAYLAEQLGTARYEMSCGQQPTALGDDPMEALRMAAMMLEMIYADLMAMGFLPPRTNWYTDPLGFIEENAAFLGSVRHLVTEPAETVH